MNQNIEQCTIAIFFIINRKEHNCLILRIVIIKNLLYALSYL